MPGTRQLKSASGARGAILAMGLALSFDGSGADLQAQTDPRASLDSSAIAARLESLFAQKRENEANQARVWPHEGPEARSESSPPPGFDKLRLEHRETRIGIQEALKELSRQSEADPGSALTWIRAGADAEYLEAVLPIVLAARTSDRETAKAILAAVKRLKPLPHFVAKALAQLDSEEAHRFLQARGVEEKSPLLLAASTGPGSATAVAWLIDLAEGQDPDRAALAIRAIDRLEPPELQRAGSAHGQSTEQTDERLKDIAPELRPLARQSLRESARREIVDLLRPRIVKTTRSEVKVALINYLGLFRESSLSAFLWLRYGEAQDDRTRLAIIGALGRVPNTGDLLLEQVEAGTTSPAVRRACVRALAAVKHLPAVPFLLEHVEDRECSEECLQALERIAGRKFGARKADWLRWWRTQPRGIETESDPDLIASRRK